MTETAVDRLATLTAMYQLWLFLHVLGAIAAFGYGFYAPIFGRASAAEPQHGNWYLRAAKRVSNGVIVPVALTIVFALLSSLILSLTVIPVLASFLLGRVGPIRQLVGELSEHNDRLLGGNAE